MNSQVARNLFIASLFAGTPGCLTSCCAFTYLPIQDYRQHLFVATALNEYSNPSFDGSEYYA